MMRTMSTVEAEDRIRRARTLLLGVEQVQGACPGWQALVKQVRNALQRMGENLKGAENGRDHRKFCVG